MVRRVLILLAILIIVILLAFAWVGIYKHARAQQPGCVVNVQCVMVQGFTPTNPVGLLIATDVSASTTLPVNGPTLGLLLTNTTGVQAWAVLGNASVVATPGVPATPVAAWETVWLPIGYNTTVAVVTAAGTAQLAATIGTGAPLSFAGLVQPAPPLPLSYAPPDAATVPTTSAQLFAAGAYTRVVRVCTLPGSTSNVWLNLHGAAAIVGQGTEVPEAGGCAPTLGGADLPLPTGAVFAIGDGGSSQNVTLTGG